MAGRVDLIVVGAGPGGSAAAYHAARQGLDVLLLDRHDFPRDKPCGDALLPHATLEITLMGLDHWLPMPPHRACRGVSLYTQTARFGELLPSASNGPIGYVIPRGETDLKLLERAREAGVRFHGGTRATQVSRSRVGKVTGVEVARNGDVLRYESPLVIVADGSGGGLVGEQKARQNIVARRQYFRNVSGPAHDHLHIFATRDMNEHGAGYGWVFYFGDGRANIGAGVSTKTLERTGRNLKDFFDRFLEEPELAGWLGEAEPEGLPKSWSLRTGMWGSRHVGQGLLLVGDAGSLIHPLSGEGVGYAMESGRLAAAFAHEAHAQQDFSAKLLSGYARQLRKKRARAHISGYMLLKLVPKLEVLEPLFRAGEKDRRLRQTFIEIFTGDAPVYSLLLRHPWVLAKLLFPDARK